MKYYHVRNRVDNLWESVDGDLCDRTEVEDNLDERDETIQALDKEVKNLQDWKDSQLDIESTWNPQDVAKEMGLGLGRPIRVAILPWVIGMKGKVASLEHFCLEYVELINKKNEKIAILEVINANRKKNMAEMAKGNQELYDKIAALTATLSERDKEIEDLREALQQIHARALLKNQTKILSIADNALNKSDALREKP